MAAVIIHEDIRGSLTQPAYRTSDFVFNDTFTDEVAQLGMITYRAEAYIETGRQRVPADSEAICLPMKVNR